MLICERDAGTIISTDAATREFLGCEDLRGRSLADILPEGALSARLREIGQLVPDEPRTATWTFVVGGRNVAVQVKLVKIGTRCVIAIPQSEPELASTSARLAYLLRATSAITYSCTDVDAEGVARVTFMSENVSEVLGYEAQEFLDDPELWTRAVHPDDRAHVFEAIAKILQGDHPVLEYRFRHKNGSWRCMRDETRTVMGPDGRLKELIGSWVDITGQRDVEEALRRSEASFRAVIDHLPQAIFVRSGTQIVYANAACAALLGFASAADLVGRESIDVAPPYNRATVKKRISDVNATGRSMPHESEWRRADGSTVPVEVEALAVEYRGVPSVVVIARDLTERRAMVARIAAADRMLANATLAAGLAHEINGPLAFLLTNLSILANDVPGLLGPEADLGRRSRADIEHLLSDAQEGAMRVRDVVRDLRLLSGPAEESGSRCDVGAVLSSCARMAWPDVEGRARLVTDIHDVAPVRGSASRLSQVFSNLIANAMHAIAPGRPNDNEIRLTARRQDADHVLVEISDTGVGMAPELVARIFEPFFTTKPAGVGTGLGLAICQSVVAAVGGTINVESEVGRGTRWSVVLPIASEQPHAAPPAREAAARGRRGRILVIDDDPLFARSLQLLLDEHEVVTFTSASLALDRIRAKEAFDLVLCDFNMPDLDGMGFHSRVSEIEPALAPRIIFVTGGAINQAGSAFLAKNRSVTLEKPFDPSALTALVARAVAAN